MLFICLFIYTIFFGDSPITQTRRLIFTLNGLVDVDLHKDVPFWGFVDIAVHLRGKISPKPQLWGVNRCFQAKHAKNSNFHIFETTASIATKYCTVMKTTKYPLWLVQICPKQIHRTPSANTIWEFLISKMMAAAILKNKNWYFKSHLTNSTIFCSACCNKYWEFYKSKVVVAPSWKIKELQ